MDNLVTGGRDGQPDPGAVEHKLRPVGRWAAIMEKAARIVTGYDTGVTLRQLFYRLVAAELLPNTRVAYQTLSKVTAEARRRGAFPALVDRTRSIHRHVCFEGVADARQWLGEIYRRDRTAGQAWSIYLGVKKAGIVEQLRAWFGDLGLPVVALGGYSSQTYVDEIVRDVEGQERPAVLIYAGDFDPSGEDIDRDFLARTGCFAEVVRVALSSAQVEEHGLPEQMGKSTDTRSAAFVARHGRLVQVELDALPPDVLRDLYAAAIERYWDQDAFEAALECEQHDRADLRGAERG